jgi:tetratricopeptide (TPR) repeat protein
MTIYHIIDDFLFELFEVENKDVEQLKSKVESFYSLDGNKPNLIIEKNILKIGINISQNPNQKRQNHKVLVDLCESGKLIEAKDLAIKLLDKYPAESEFHRILGQVCSDLGNQDEAIDSLIYALKWNPKNEYALLMLGNIFAKFKSDIKTAMSYYDQVLVLKPEDNIALNNIGANLMQLGQIKEAKDYFNRAIELNPDYPNTHFAMSMLADTEKNMYSAFDYSLKALTKCVKKDAFFQNCFQHSVAIANKMISSNDVMPIIEKFVSKLSYESEKEIKVEEDNSIPTAAKIEFAENYNRNYHLVKYKSDYPAVEHLIMHELHHLELVVEARKEKENQLFTTNDSFKKKFLYSLEKETKQYRKKGYSEESVSNVLNMFFDGLNRQVYNTPIDLFIEDRIFNNYSSLRPYQYLSMLAMVKEGIDATTRKEIVDLAPKSVLSKSKTFNLINAIHFKDLFGLDLISEHNPSKFELNQANELYTEFLDYRKDKAPGEEYELVQHWGEDLKLNGYFELVPENKEKRKTIDDVISEIEKDPYGLESADSFQERQMKKFLKEHSTKDTNMAVAMYMVGALEKFQKLSSDKVKSIAFEFATLGMSGIDPNKDGYTVPYFGSDKFSGYKALAYYYVSWAIAVPEALSELQLPFDDEYKLAKQMKNL